MAELTCLADPSRRAGLGTARQLPGPITRPSATPTTRESAFWSGIAGWSHKDVLFVDDSLEHIEKARSVCRTLHVSGRGGLQADELVEIRKAAGVHT